MMDVDETPELVSSRSSSSSSRNAPFRPASAPVNNNNNNNNNGSGGLGTTNPPRAIRTAPTSTNGINNNNNNNDQQNVRVVARVRPLSTKELNERSGESIVAYPRQSNIRVVEPSSSSSHDSVDNYGMMGSSSSVVGGGDNNNNKRKFDFDSVFGPASTQKEVYENTCGDMISSSIFRGFNATILAYGQTGSGKVSFWICGVWRICVVVVHQGAP